MKKTNKLISILLVMAMMLSMAPLSLTAFAASVPSYSASGNGVRIYANGTNLFIEAGTSSGTAVYYNNNGNKVYLNPNGAKGDDLSASEIFAGTNSSNTDNFDVSIVMTGGSIGTIYTGKNYGYLMGKVTVAVTGSAQVGLLVAGSKTGRDNGIDHHTGGSLAIYDTVGVSVQSGVTNVDGMIKKTSTGWDVSGSAVVPNGVTMTIGSDQTVTVPTGASVKNYGAIVNNGTLELYGSVTGNNITGNGTINCYTAYIENVSSVSSVSAKVNGNAVVLENGQYRLSGGKLYIWLPEGDAEVILNNVKYYGTIIKGSPKKLDTAYTAISSITGIPSEIVAYITTKLSPMANQATFVPGFSYEILTDGTTAPEARVTDSSIYAAGAGVIKLKATASDGYTSYSKVFDITVKDSGYAASVTNGCVTISKYSDTQLKVTHSEYTGGYTLINKDDTLIITGTSTSKDNVIIVESGDVNIVLKDCNISFSNLTTPPFNVASGAKVKLIPVGTSSLANKAMDSTSASITTAINVPKGAELIIDGPGTLNVTGGDSSAAIGTHYSQAPGTITINGGTINATSGYYAAAIGSGGSFYAKENYAGGTITINGGTVKAESRSDGAGIGGGMRCDGGTITINGGTVTAESSSGAGIGGGGAYGSNNVAGNGGKITINGGTVIAKSTYYGAGIGSGYSKEKKGGDGGTIVINGGNIKATSNGGEAIGKGKNGVSSGTLKDANGNDLTLNTITLDGAAADTAVIEVEDINYGLKDVKTLDTNKLYFYLPADTAATSITAGGNEYICNGNLTYYTAHSWANNDGVCANGCGLECDHAGQSGATCGICGKNLHNHAYNYTANGNVITATCSNADGYCTDTNGGTLTISAPADLYADGTTAKEATVENNLADTSVAVNVTYSTADGKAPTTAGTYTASVTIGGATATVQFEIIKRSSTAENFIYTAPENLVYDGTPKYATVEASPEITDMGAITVTYYKDGEAVDPINAGTYTVKVSTAETDKYYGINDVEIASFTIEKKAVTVTATDASKIYGEADPEDFSFSYNLLYPDHKLNGQPARTPGENVGVYEIGQGTLTNDNNPNFDITFISGKFTIEPDASGIEGITPLNVKSSDKAKIEYVYNQLENAVTDLADDAKKAEWDNLKSDCVEMLALISDTADEINRIVNAVNDYDINTVTGDDVPDLLDILDDANALLETDNLISEEKETLNQAVKDIQSLISRYDRISAQFGDIKERMNGYDEATVKSTDKADIEELVADIKELTDGQNLTAEEREYLVNADAECDKFLAKIAETTAEYNRVIAAANGYDKATVTSADRDALDKLRMDAHYLAVTDNVTEEEKENLQIVFENLTEMVETLINVGNEIERIISAVGGYDEATVKYSDYKDILQLIDDIEVLTDGQNITEDERASLEELNTKANLLVAKIRSTADEIARITRAVNAYNIDTVKSSDKTDIEKLIARIRKLTDGDNITADERNQLNNNEATLNALLAKINATADEIARIEEAVNSYDEATVKSTDKADLEQLVEDIKALTDATNITEDERTKLGELDTTVDSLIKKIDDTATEIARIDEAVNAYDEETVKSSDEEAIEQLKEDIKALTDGDNITEDERATLGADNATVDALVEKLAEVAEEIKKVDETVKSYDEDTVKSSDSEELANLKEDVQALIDSTNTTENEKTALEEMIKVIEGLEGKIEEIEQQLEEIAEIENSYTPETVTSDDKATIEETIAKIDAVNPDNLTDEQRAEYAEIKAELETLLNEIETAEKDVADIGTELEMFDEKRVTIFWEEDIEALKAELDELLADENMGEAEKAKLNEYKAQADNLIEIIHTPVKYLSLRFFYLIWDCFVWMWNSIVSVFK